MINTIGGEGTCVQSQINTLKVLDLSSGVKEARSAPRKRKEQKARGSEVKVK
jgi:hypothetical protein